MLKQKIIALAAAITCMTGTVEAQTYSYKHNIDITAGGGLQSSQFDPSKGDHNAKFGWVINGNYRRQLNEHWGVGAGIGVGFYKSKASYDTLMVSNMVVDEENGREYERKTGFDNWVEAQRMIELEIPVAAYYLTPVNEKWTFMADAGIKLMIPLWNKYKSVDGYYETTGYFEDYTNIEYSDLPQHNFQKYYDESGKADIKPIAGAGFVDAGMLYDLKHDRQLYLGLYFSYTFTNLAKKSSSHLYDGKDYIGVVSSDEVDKNHLIAAGIKVGMTLGRPKKTAVADSLFAPADTVFTKPDTVFAPADTVVIHVVDSSAIKLAQRQKVEQDSLKLVLEQTRLEQNKLIQQQDSLQAALKKESADKAKLEAAIKWLNTNLRVNFDKSQAVVEPNEHNDKHIAVLAEYIKNYPNKIITVTGHTCNLGQEATNVKLGLKRAEAMKQELISAGIPEQNIKTKSMGSKKPIVPNTTEKNRKKNRRVEISVE